jgi:phage host-nuclease inhibitor protein Gam
MAKGKRKSVSLSAGITSLQYSEALAKYAGNDARIAAITSEMDEAITEIRELYDDDLNILSKENEMHMAVIKGYCVENREDLFVSKKSIDTLHGTIGFRMSSPSIKTLSGYNWEKVLANLKEKLPAYVRTQEEPDKEKLLAERATKTVAPLLAVVGLKVEQGEKFYIELKKETVQSPQL